MNTINHPRKDQEKQELLEEVALLEQLAASIRKRMKKLQGNKVDIVTSITARMRRLEPPEESDPEET